MTSVSKLSDDVRGPDTCSQKYDTIWSSSVLSENKIKHAFDAFLVLKKEK